jgi:hypothetical protein
LLWAVLAALFLTGLLLAPGALEMRLEWELPWRLVPRLRLPIAAAHAVLALLGLFALGALSALHVRAGLRRERNLTTGLALLLSFAVLALSAVGIYYLGDEKLGVWASAVHLVIGLLVALPLALHVAIARRLRAETPASRTASLLRKRRAPLPRETPPHRGFGASP